MIARNGAGPASATTDGEARKVFATGERRAPSKPDHPKTQPIRDERPIASIKVGKRYRRDLGDIAEFARRIASVCVLWLWTTNYHMLNGAREVLEAWGFAPITILTWAKDRYGLGAWLRGQTEHCIFATRGKPLVQLTGESTLLHAAVREHSQKPDEFYALVERLCPAPRYAELFARRQRVNWDGHGDEAPGADAFNTTTSTTEAAE